MGKSNISIKINSYRVDSMKTFGRRRLAQIAALTFVQRVIRLAYCLSKLDPEMGF